MISKALSTGLLALLLLAGLPSCDQGDDPTEFSLTLRLSHVFSPNEELAKSIERVAERIDSHTDGHVRAFSKSCACSQ